MVQLWANATGHTSCVVFFVRDHPDTASTLSPRLHEQPRAAVERAHGAVCACRRRGARQRLVRPRAQSAAWTAGHAYASQVHGGARGGRLQKPRGSVPRVGRLNVYAKDSGRERPPSTGRKLGQCGFPAEALDQRAHLNRSYGFERDYALATVGRRPTPGCAARRHRCAGSLPDR
jgi:hypothetical protein